MKNNPLLDGSPLPDFSTLAPDHVEPAIDHVISELREVVTKLTALDNPEWDSYVAPLEEASDHLHRVWSPVSHLNAVRDSKELREAYDAVLPKLTEISTELGQNPLLLAGYQKLKDVEGFNDMPADRVRVIENAIRDFRLAGVNLPDAKKARVADINRRLADLSNRFSKNVLDATLAWSLDIVDETKLEGLPDSARAQAKQAAEDAGVEGWRFNLQAPSYIAVVTHMDNRDLRREMYEAYATRASDQGPSAGQFDNNDIMVEIMGLRKESALLLGFDSYAELSLATKMAKSPQEVVNFLTELAEKSRPSAEQDVRDIESFARNELGIETLEAWDLAYVSEKLRRARFDFDEEEIRQFFPLNRVLKGLFEVTERLFDVVVVETDAPSVWHRDVRYFEIRESDGTHRGAFYIDLYARDHKRGGAWMSGVVSRRVDREKTQLPVAFLTCNFSAPVNDQEVLLRHQEVTTLFHEFGHTLHHTLTRVDHAAISGISGVEWDAVELPSQFLENWCWNSESLIGMSGHFETGEPLPAELLDRMQQARTFQAGLQMLRQIEFSLFDMNLHMSDNVASVDDIQAVLNAVREQVAVLTPPAFNRFQNGFSHVFAGGYSAGYYSYKWAEVLSADAFSLFEEKGIFDQKTGAEFRQCILEKGGSANALELFVDFRGREPSVDALLRHSGMAA